MTKIDFLSSQEADAEARLRLVCRVAQKALRSGEEVFIACANAEQAALLDSLLWSFEPESFIPHANFTGEPAIQKAKAPVLLSHGEDCGEHHGVLINLRSPAPAFFSRFERLFELIVQTPEVLTETRTNWSYYKSRGYPLDLKHI
ncbi:DNA polymerase III subunit chi [Simiduia curdlanivorans]|uniref:DNA polymerase III subunit chi n=1 Tax=Simiduia curdlanivorans TaxID=1492769 RepID=A0ABV8V5J6_9GAMM|nr:DNA polymerase III subunit chi [Simiduia curdlanivorans]MDN3640657.1 DNA polymerase III subunit chi [Simiduia curdlanivorans]